MGSENLSKPNIRAELEKNAEVYKSKIEELMISSDKHEIQLNAAKYLMDQAVGKAKQSSSTDVTTGGDKINMGGILQDIWNKGENKE